MSVREEDKEAVQGTRMNHNLCNHNIPPLHAWLSICLAVLQPGVLGRLGTLSTSPVLSQIFPDLWDRLKHWDYKICPKAISPWKPSSLLPLPYSTLCKCTQHCGNIQRNNCRNGWTPHNWFQIPPGSSNELELVNLKLSKTNLHNWRNPSLIAWIWVTALSPPLWVGI